MGSNEPPLQWSVMCFRVIPQWFHSLRDDIFGNFSSFLFLKNKRPSEPYFFGVHFYDIVYLRDPQGLCHSKAFPQVFFLSSGYYYFSCAWSLATLVHHNPVIHILRLEHSIVRYLLSGCTWGPVSRPGDLCFQQYIIHEPFSPRDSIRLRPIVTTTAIKLFALPYSSSARSQKLFFFSLCVCVSASQEINLYLNRSLL